MRSIRNKETYYASMSKFTDLGNNKKDENTSHQEHIEGGMPQPIRQFIFIFKKDKKNY